MILRFLADFFMDASSFDRSSKNKFTSPGHLLLGRASIILPGITVGFAASRSAFHAVGNLSSYWLRVVTVVMGIDRQQDTCF